MSKYLDATPCAPQFFRGSDFDDGGYAALDAMNPFGSPFGNNGYIKNCNDLGFSRGAGKVAGGALAIAGGALAWSALGLPTFQVGVITSPTVHVFYGVTEGGATTFLHAAGAAGAIETTEAAGLAVYALYWNTLTGVPIIAPAAAAVIGVSATNCATGACGAFLRGWGL